MKVTKAAWDNPDATARSRNPPICKTRMRTAVVVNLGKREGELVSREEAWALPVVVTVDTQPGIV